VSEPAISPASDADAAAVTALQNAVALQLTDLHGKGHWSRSASEEGVRRGIEGSTVLVARAGEQLVGSLRLVTKKPWAVDPAYFTQVRRALYLVDMAVSVEAQGLGVGRALIDEARRFARQVGAGAIRLDAYDGPVGAGDFYSRCGFSERGRVVYRGTPLVYFEWLCEPRTERHGRRASRERAAHRGGS
jgi:GNAT superfamily N-acetyltransferase